MPIVVSDYFDYEWLDGFFYIAQGGNDEKKISHITCKISGK